MNSKLVLGSLVLLSSSCVPRTYNKTDVSETNISEDYKSIIDRNSHQFGSAAFTRFDPHDETFRRMAELYRLGAMSKDSRRALVHFDYHSDLYRNDWHVPEGERRYGNINIGNYINTMISEREIQEVWWILPDETRSTKSVGSQAGCAPIGSQNDLYWGRMAMEDWQFRDGPKDQLICVGHRGHFQYRNATEACPNGTRTVKFFKRTIGDLLDGDEKIPGPTILDIDADFFDMSGKYANEFPVSRQDGLFVPFSEADSLRYMKAEPKCYSLHYSKSRLQQEFSRVAYLITEKLRLQPDYFAYAMSPSYAVENQLEILDFLEYMGSKTRVAPLVGDEKWLAETRIKLEPCGTKNYDSRICADTDADIPVYDYTGHQFATAKPGEPICNLHQSSAGNAKVHFLFPPPGGGYVAPDRVCECDVAKLKACLRGGGEIFEEGECRKKYCR